MLKIGSLDVIASALLLLPVAAHSASNLDLTVGAGAEFHDNASMTSGDNKQSDLVRIGRAAIAYTTDRQPTQVDLAYRAERRDYRDDIQEDETAINGSSLLRWQLAPQVFDVFLQNEASTQLVDRTAANISSNREQRSVTTVGADLYGRLRSTDTLSLTPSYADVHVSGDSGVDSKRTALNAGWLHDLSPVSDLSLNVTRTAVDAEVDGNNYDSDAVVLAYAARLSRLHYSVGAGANRIDRDVGDTVDGALARISADYDGGALRWSIALINQLTDSGIGVASFDASAPADSADAGVGGFDIVESTQADFKIAYDLAQSSTLSANLGYLKYDYDTLPRDEDDYSAGVRYDHTINTFWQLSASATFRHADFTDENVDLQQDDSETALTLSYLASRSLTLGTTLGHKERNSSEGVGDYSDPYVLVFFDYQIL